jgi:NAD(P)-dependent dehydrogenase (short-subunit alcohol dehydrogenase family)
MAGKLSGRVALVTGAASGIGRSSALAFASDGAKVVVADVLDEQGRETVGRIDAAGGSDRPRRWPRLWSGSARTRPRS